jgi:Flp pilus assembly pilin Flp
MVDRFNIFVGELFARLQREDGQGMVEYALVLGVVVAIGASVAFTGLHTSIESKFSSLFGSGS